MKSREGRIVAFYQVINNDGGKTPGVDGVVFEKQNVDLVVEQLKNL
jgi:hypothetical protein